MLMLTIAYSFAGQYVYKSDCMSMFTQTLQPLNGLVCYILVFLSFNMFISYPAMSLAAFDTVEQMNFLRQGRYRRLKVTASRSVIIIIITIVSLSIPNFSIFLNLAGSICCSIVAFILPPLLYNIEFRDTMTTTRKYVNYLVMLFGIAGSTLSVVN